MLAWQYDFVADAVARGEASDRGEERNDLMQIHLVDNIDNPTTSVYQGFSAAQNDCPKCQDRPVTWANIRVGRYCDKHQGEIMQAIHESA